MRFRSSQSETRLLFISEQICALCLRSGNGLLLKGGKEAVHTNTILHQIITDTIYKASAHAVPVLASMRSQARYAQ
jgi:gamma-glutamyl phosphate reductase